MMILEKTCKFSFNDYYGVPWSDLEDIKSNDNISKDAQWFYNRISERLLIRGEEIY